MSMKVQAILALSIISVLEVIPFSGHVVLAQRIPIYSPDFCRSYARDYAQRNSRGVALGGAMRGAATGAIIGGIVDGGRGAGKGASIGATVGAISGGTRKVRSYDRLYDLAYEAVFNLETVTCKELLLAGSENRELMMSLFHGFFNGKKNETSINVNQLAQITDEIQNSCADNPKRTLMSVFQEYRGNR